MSEFIQAHTVVVVADGVGARFFRFSGHMPALILTEEDHLKPNHLANSGPAGHRPMESSHQQTDEATFVKQLASDLYRRAHAGDFEHLIVIADPRTLGTLRPLLHKEVQGRIVKEIAKSHTHSTIMDIAKAAQS